jgi:hypothetical protein
MWNKNNILEAGKKLFFENGSCIYGRETDMTFEIWDYKRQQVNEEITVGELYCTSKMQLLRFYFVSMPYITNEVNVLPDDGIDNELPDIPIIYEQKMDTISSSVVSESFVSNKTRNCLSSKLLETVGVGFSSSSTPESGQKVMILESNDDFVKQLVLYTSPVDQPLHYQLPAGQIVQLNTSTQPDLFSSAPIPADQQLFHHLSPAPNDQLHTSKQPSSLSSIQTPINEQLLYCLPAESNDQLHMSTQAGHLSSISPNVNQLCTIDNTELHNMLPVETSCSQETNYELLDRDRYNTY